MSTLEAKLWGTRGSVAVAGSQYARYGGNTTCVEVLSDCLPQGYRLLIDAGTGIIPFGLRLKQERAETKTIGIMFTHYHHDHTQGLLMLPQLYDKSIELQLLGPQENGIGPHEVLKALMHPPLFPVALAEVSSHIRFKGIEHPAGRVIVAHRDKAPTLITLEELENADTNPSRQLRLGDRRVNANECLVIKMYRSNHPERTISYRFEDRASGKSFVFLTDHENTDGIPLALRKHLAGTSTLIMDAQYTRKQYDDFCAGFGHSTPDYCLMVAKEVGAARLVLTHHDPGRDDAGIDQVLSSVGRDHPETSISMAADGDTIAL